MRRHAERVPTGDDVRRIEPALPERREGTWFANVAWHTW